MLPLQGQPDCSFPLTGFRNVSTCLKDETFVVLGQFAKGHGAGGSQEAHSSGKQKSLF